MNENKIGLCKYVTAVDHNDSVIGCSIGRIWKAEQTNRISVLKVTVSI